MNYKGTAPSTNGLLNVELNIKWIFISSKADVLTFQTKQNKLLNKFSNKVCFTTGSIYYQYVRKSKHIYTSGFQTLLSWHDTD